MSQTLCELITEGASRVPPTTAAVMGGRQSMSYGELLEGARSIAATLAASGIGRGNRVGLWLEKTPAAFQAMLGILYAGAAYVPLDPRQPWQRCRTIALDCALSGLIVDGPRLQHLPSLLEGHALRGLLLEGPEADVARTRAAFPKAELLSAARAGRTAKLAEPGPDDVAYILYTSGSTGTPKGVVHTHASGASFVEWVRSRFKTGPQDVFSSHAPFHFDLSISDLFASLASGASVRLLTSTEAMLAPWLARQVDAMGITVWYSVPSILISMLEAGFQRPHALRLLFFAGEVFPTPQLRRLRSALPGVELFNLFGPTETNVCTYYEVPRELPEGNDAPIPIGKGCDNLETFVVDDGGAVVDGVGAKGTLWARGGNIMRGYWNDPERTARMLLPDPRREGTACCTGDQVRIQPDGNYEFLGRRDHMVKTRGYRVELGEIESTLAAHAAVLEAVATPVPDPTVGNRIVATVVLRAGTSADEETLHAVCVERMPSYMVPERIEIRTALPRTSTGKADRSLLRSEWEQKLKGV